MKKKDAYFSNAMSSLSRSAQWPNHCPTYYLQGLILFEHFKEPADAMTKLDRAFSLCPEWPPVQEARKRVLQQTGGVDTTPVPVLPTQDSDEGIDFEPTPFE
jgi:hypothetical protein